MADELCAGRSCSPFGPAALPFLLTPVCADPRGADMGRESVDGGRESSAFFHLEVRMVVLVTYDVSTKTSQGRRRLRRVARTCCNYGQRVQNSVFECLVNPAQWTHLREKLMKEFNPEEDSLRFYFLGSNWRHRVEHVGAKPSIDPEGLLTV